WFTKSKFENQALVWDSPWGRGYPGWHIECSAMSMKYLGEQFDIHAGGIDHIPIHHTNEIAQSEAATGKHPWVNYWLHNEFLIMEKGKMSKSAGGFITLQDVIDRGFDPLDYRYFLLGGHYRSQLQFSWTAMEGARNARRSLLEKIGAFAEKVTDTSEKNTEKVTDTINGTKNYLEAFNRALEDDLSTPRALAELWGLLKENARLLSEPAVQKTKIYEVIAAVIDMDRVLGLNLGQAVIKNEKREDPSLALEMETLIKERAEAKKAKNFAKADEIRNLLKERGIVLTDSPAGTTWKRQV
ncbi:MAG: class I tRNA ligase family protein, partial [Treponema sp.]|nr:class I tRNA ligase family protein [Treponema sp.]